MGSPVDSELGQVSGRFAAADLCKPGHAGPRGRGRPRGQQSVWSAAVLWAAVLAACGGNGEGSNSEEGEERLAAGILNGEVEDGEPATLYLGNVAAGVDCTGALVSGRVVLTAKHCVLDFPEDSWSAWVGPNREQGTYGVDSIVMTPGDVLDGQDVALMTLAEAPGVAPYALGRDFDEFEPDDTFAIIGYGLTETGGDNRKRRTTGDLYEVGPALHDNLFDNEFLLQGDATGAASGDSGGPVLDEEGTLVGVMSRANEDYFTFCSRVDRFLDLIDGAIAAAGDAPEPECEVDDDCPTGSCVDGDCVEVDDPPDDCETSPDLCAPELGGLGDECTTRDDCDSAICGRSGDDETGLCTMECDGDAICGTGFACVDSAGGGGVCWPAGSDEDVDTGTGLTGDGSCSAAGGAAGGLLPALLTLLALRTGHAGSPGAPPRRDPACPGKPARGAADGPAGAGAPGASIESSALSSIKSSAL